MSFEDTLTNSYGTSETVYGTHEDSQMVMSEKVQALAGSIYREFEQMIARYDQDVVKTLMPLLVNILECLDSAYKANQVYEVDLELYKDDNEQLMTQYEREKAARKISEQKLLECEDLYEGEKKKWSSHIESMESIHRMMELKNKNLLDHISRLEDRENELKKEYAKLHDRYTDLFKTHMDYMERTKLLLSTASDRGEVRGRLGLNPVGRSSGLVSYGFASFEDCASAIEQTESIPGSPVSLSSSPPSPPIGSELAAVKTVERAHQTDPVTQQSQATSPVAPPTSKSQTKSEKRSANTLYQELAFNDTDAAVNETDDGMDITGCYVHPGEYASSVNDNYFGMGKEVENLILENNELLATKNALNVVKDDLIVKVDELTGEQEILREKVANLSAVRESLSERVTQLEDEMRHLKETMANNAGGGENEDDADVPMSQRRRFTRVEMARVLMERNQYKERFIELQDAVRYTEMVRASRIDSSMDKKTKQSFWKMFSNLFSAGERPQRPLSTPHLRSSATQPAMRHSRTQADFLETQLTDHHPRRHDSSDQARQVRAHVRKEDGRTHAYGWSLPSKLRSEQAPREATGSEPSGVPVPVPVYCRPLAEHESRMTLLCAAGVNLAGGRTRDGGCLVGQSVFYHNDHTMSLADELTEAQLAHSPEIEQIDRQIQSTHGGDKEKNMSSLAWICSNKQANSQVMIIDANNPAEVIETFTVKDKLILCIASVPGAIEDDYKVIEQTQEKANDFQRPSSSADTKDNGVVDDSLIIGAAKLVKATILPNPASTPESPTNKDEEEKDVEETTAPESPPLSSTPVNEKASSPEPAVDAIIQEQSDAKSRSDEPVDRPMSTIAPTMWLGTKSGNLYVHSAVANYSRCLVRVKLPDAILSIVWCASRCVVSLADGCVAVFARLADGQWDMTQYWLVTLGSDKGSVRCVCAVGCVVWCGYKNRVFVLEPVNRLLLHSFEAHPRQESQIRQMAAHGDGVWVTIKMDSTLRLYHAHTYQHLRDVDIEPYVSKMLGTGKLGFSLVRITALLISSGRLWIGTSNGVVISVPLSEDVYKGSSRDSTGSVTGIRADALEHGPTSLSYNIPCCSMAHAQLSFHGHREAVTFFVAVPAAGTTPPRSPDEDKSGTSVQPPPMLVISGGEGYIDFRIEEHADEETDTASHVIVWQIDSRV